MTIVDTHCHVSPYWFEPVEALLHHMDAAGVERATLVQYHGQFDNEYQSRCVRRWPDRFLSVVQLDTGRPDAPDELERLVAEGARGVRMRPFVRSPGEDPLAIWRKAAELGIPVTTGSPRIDDLAGDEFEQLVRSLPQLSVIVEHLGSSNSPDREPAPYPKRQRVFALARYPNVSIKFHGLGEFCARNTVMTNPFPFEGNVLPILDMALEAFGPQRMMWGSDWPPVSRREGYANALRFPEQLLAGHTGEGERAAMFGETALRTYGWK